ncbi:MAG: DedA family protein [Candidatus Pacebacteria bacterium]|nr:DedA family protein [Candidatus Paceibacterota bacterium]
MKLFFLNSLQKLRFWTLKWADSKNSALALFILAFAEASFFPIPPDVLLIGILAINSTKWLKYAIICTAGSVLGGLFGYLIGWGFYEAVGQRIVDFYGLQATVDAIGLKYSQHAFWTVFTAAFTPIPFKVITITAGLFKISLIQLVAASVVGRAARFFMVALILKFFGKRVNNLVIKYFDILSLAAVVVVILSFVAIKYVF